MMIDQGSCLDEKIKVARLELEKKRSERLQQLKEHQTLIEERNEKLHHLGHKTEQILNEIVNPRSRCRQLYNTIIREISPGSSSYVWTLEVRALQMEHCCQIYQNQLEKAFGALEMSHEFCDKLHHEASFVNSEEAKESMHKVAHLTEEMKDIREDRENMLEMQQRIINDLKAKYGVTLEESIGSDLSLTGTSFSDSEAGSSSSESPHPVKASGILRRASTMFAWFGKRESETRPPVVVNFV